MVSSVGFCLGAVLARGRLTGRPLSRVSASDESMKNTSRKNIVSIMGMISIFVRLSSRRRLNSMALLLLTQLAHAVVLDLPRALLVMQLGQHVHQARGRLLRLRRDGAQPGGKVVIGDE